MPARQSNARRKPTKVVSIQAARKRGHKSPTASMQAKTLAKAYRQGMVWDDDEVSLLINGIEKDLTTYEMALALGRSYYGVAGARAHVAFALRHFDVFKRSKK